MNEFDKYYEDEFFIIDSNNINSINSKLYGFCIHDSNFIQNQEITHDFNLLDYGVFINVNVTDNEIKIYQDFNGSYGIYLFKQNDYFAISNSFWKLVEHLKGNYQLSVNEDFTKALFLRDNLYAFSYKDTLVNEIELIPRNIIFHINKENSKFDFEEIDYEESSVELNSKEGLELLDNWFNKWINILRALKEKTNNISFDLSGGMASRSILSILLNSNIDLDKVQINSLTDSVDNHQQDLEIANQIADENGFKLNEDVFTSEKIFFKELDTTINSSSYLKLGFNNKFFNNFFKYKDPVYSFNGRGRDILKGLPLTNKTNYSEEFIFSYLFSGDTILSKIQNNMFASESSKKIFEKDLNTIEELFNEDEDWLPWRHYKETIARNYYGKDSVEEYFANKFSLSPFFDPILNKLKLTTDECNNRKLLLCVILSRYCPKLLDIEFEGESFEDETIEYANSINNILPYEKIKNDFVSGPEIKSINSNKDESHNQKELDDYLNNVFYSSDFKNKFIEKLNSEIYYDLVEQMESEKYYPMKFFSPTFSLVKIYDDIDISHLKDSKISEWIKKYMNNNNRNSEIIKSNLLKYNKARIDLQNEGDGNDLELLEYSDENLWVFKKWTKNNLGYGLNFHSQKNELSLKVKCIGDGTFKMYLRGQEFRDKNNEKVSIYIDFRFVSINNKIILDSSKLVSRTDPYTYEFNVNNGDIIDLKFKWIPLNYSSDAVNINQELKRTNEKLDRVTNRLNGILERRRKRLAKKEDASKEKEKENPLRSFPVSDEVIIDVEDVSMEFMLAEEKVDNFKEYIIRLVKRDLPKKTKFRALNHLSFKVHKGERLGVIGFNGAGKSTLLKILSSVLKPTEGKVTVKGSVAPLLELGAGFDHNYTGEENIFLNGSILGLQKEFLEEKYDEILEFSELDHFIKVPVKNYSSGMKAKLGFSIATMVSPDILILDEVLSVGDVKFKEKSRQKLEELMGEGVTVIMVTHSVSAIRKMCNKVIWLDKGNLIRYGDVDEVCDEYIEFAKTGTEEDLKNIKLN